MTGMPPSLTDVVAALPRSPGGVRVEHLVTSGTFSLDGGTWEVDNNVWILGDDDECVVFDAPHDAEPILAAIGERRLLAVVCTHAHDDHRGGFGAVLREFQMNRAVIGARGPAPPPPPGAHSGLTPARGPLVKVREGDMLAEGKGVRITVLNPRGGEHLPTQSGENNSSVALLVSFGRTRALLCGDMERAAEERRRGYHVARGRGKPPPPENELRPGEVDGEEKADQPERRPSPLTHEKDEAGGGEEVDRRPGEDAVPAVE